MTLQGLGGAFGGALAVGLAAAAVRRNWRLIRSAVVAGLGGALIDSLLGATLQAEYRCPRCNAATEARVHKRCGTPAVHQRGVVWMTNDTVNLLATLAGAALGWWQTPDAAVHVRGGS